MNRQSGNILIYILGAIFLLGLLIMVVKGSFQEGTGIDTEQAMLKANQLQQYAGELERGVGYVLRNGVSESDIRFAHPDLAVDYGTYSDSENMVFAPKGGGVEFRSPPSGVNDGSMWGFHANTHITGLGDATAKKAELIAVLPNVTEAVCNQINRNVKQTINLALNTDPIANGCVSDSAFDGTFLSGAPANILDDTKLGYTPAAEACIRCANMGPSYHYYKVLMAR